jgi:hypothetical protein
VVLLSVREIHISELEEYCNSLARDTMKDHEKRFSERIKNVKEAAGNLNNAAVRFGTAVRNAWGSLDKTTSEYGGRLTQIIQENALAISNDKTLSNYKDAERFHEQSVQTLNRTILSVRKYIPKLHRALRGEMATLNSSLARLENTIKALGIALDQSPGGKLESLRREAEGIIQKQAELMKLRSLEQNEAEVLRASSEQQSKMMGERELLFSTPDFLELKRYEDALRLKGDEIRQFFQPLTKPLLKLERMAAFRQASVNIQTLRGLIANPTETIVTNQTFSVTDLLNTLEEKLNQHALEFEEKRRRKALESIGILRAGAVDKMREEYLALQANTQETMRQLRTKGLLEKKETLDRLLAEKRTQIEEASSKKRELNRKIDDLVRTILKQKNTVESQVSALTARPISILTE